MLGSRIRGKLEALRSSRAAARYARDGDALRFTVQTLKELPAQPPPGRGRLVLFAHFDPQNLVDPYVRFYLESLYNAGSTIVFVSGSPDLQAESAASISSFCAGIYTRRTLALDFGSWHLAWAQLQAKSWSLDQFDQFLLANDSVYGPLFPLEEMFAALQGADMYGAVESLEWTPHLQSFFLLWDLNPGTRRFLKELWQDFRYILDKDELIQKYEIGLSASARAHGLTLKPFLTDAAVGAAVEAAGSHPSALSPAPVNNTLLWWDVLIGKLRFPFLKTAVPRRNRNGSPRVNELPSLLREWTDYDPALIENNLRRLGISLSPANGSQSPSSAAQ